MNQQISSQSENHHLQSLQTTTSVNTKVAQNQDGLASSSKFVLAMRKIYNPLGFSKGYNFPLCKSSRVPILPRLTVPVVIFAGAMLGFSLARLSYMNISGSAKSSYRNSSAPGEWYYYRTGHYRIGITLHLVTIIPAGILMVFQFVPIIRHKFLLFHRVNGYTIVLLVFLSNVGALMIARRAFGGGLDTQAAVGVLVILTTVSISMAYYNIKKLQIEQHRAWMLRAMFYLGTIITTRLIMIIAALIISSVGSYYQVQTCGKVGFLYDSAQELYNLYPECLNATEDTNIIVHAQFGSQAEQIGASLGLSFGMALWMSILLHLVGVEIYLNLTPRESERLRKVSYERQLEAGFKNPGSAGSTVDRWGDAEKWTPPPPFH